MLYRGYEVNYSKNPAYKNKNLDLRAQPDKVLVAIHHLANDV